MNAPFMVPTSAVASAPVAIGMLLRHHFSRVVENHARRVRSVSIFLVVMLLALIVIDQWAATQRLFFEAAVLAVLFSGFAALACWGIGFMLRLDLTDRYVFSVEFAIRNIGIAAVTSMPSEKQSSPGYRSLPTATEDQLGSGKWSAGITGVVLTQPEWNFQFTWQFLFPKNEVISDKTQL